MRFSLKTFVNRVGKIRPETLFHYVEEEIAAFLSVNWGSVKLERELEMLWIQRLYKIPRFNTG